ncbi:MAG: penicillin-binding transpeptidase domain-containing protein [Candidatus Coprovivens sp.]
MKKTYFIILISLLLIITYRFISLRYINHDYYIEEYLKLTNKLVYGTTTPRGKILDRNGKILVDNIGIPSIIYRNINNDNIDELVNTIYPILSDIEQASIEEQQNYYLEHNNYLELLTEKELEDYNNRKINKEELKDIIISRLNLNYNEEEKVKIKIYTLLKNGYSYDNKIIKEDVTKEECAKISELNLTGLSCEYTSKRVYLYDTLNGIYGKVGNISKENKEYYLEKGYSLSDKVGLSYLEKQYDDYLKGTKATYKVNEDNTLTLLTPSTPGNDIILSIDIEKQLAINDIIKKNLDLASTLKNTDYYNTSYVIVSDPNTGEIIASTGISKINESYYDISNNILTSSFTVGSIVKGASHTVAYQNNLININEKIKDSCVKLYQTPQKCSYKRLGYINDIEALKTSSNYYQFINAIKLTGNKYKYNMKLNVTEEHFNIYRNTFALFGLGSSTGIDLENESLGIRGQKIADDLLLNLSIGQYDTYTPLQLTNYINTISTKGKRYNLHYLKEVMNNNNIIYKYEPKLLSNIEDNWFFDRIHEGFKEVIYNGTGRGYTDIKYKPAGKTGTSEVVYSKDITTINQTYIMFAPYDNPKYTIVVISPNISFNNEKDNYIAPINRYISKEVSKIMFEN